jgi:Tfp pilus assembly protein PilO
MSGTEKLEMPSASPASENGASDYSPFWAVAIVFLVLMIGYTVQLYNQWDQRHQARNTEAALVEMMPRVKAINAKLEGVSQELIRLSATSATAKQIVEEFGIRRN